MKIAHAFIIVMLMSPLANERMILAADPPAGIGAQPAPVADQLAEGPIAVTVVLKRGSDTEVTQKGTLFSLTAEKLVWYPDKSTTPIIVKPGKEDRLRIECPEGKWAFDAKAGAITGKAVAAKPIDTVTDLKARGAEERYLYFYLERLLQQLDSAIILDRDDEVKSLKARAAALSKHMATDGLDRALQAEYAAVDNYVEVQQAKRKEAREVIASTLKAFDKIGQEQAAARMKNTGQSFLGLFQLGASALRERSVPIPGAPGWALRESDPDLQGVVSGLSILQSAQSSYASRMAELEGLKSDKSMTAYNKILELQKEYSETRKSRSKLVRELGVKNFELPDGSVADEQEQMEELLRKSKDYSELAKLLKARAEVARGKTQFDQPFSISEKCSAEALVPVGDPSKRAEVLFGFATSIVGAVKLVPKGAVYDVDRCTLLKIAAGLAMRAADIEIGMKSSERAFNFKAIYTLKILDAISLYGGSDLGGELREMRARATLRVGRLAEALQLAGEVAELRKKSPSFQFELARIYAANGRLKESMKSLEESIKNGFQNIELAKKTEDFAKLRGMKPYGQQFTELMAVNLEAIVVFPKAFVLNDKPADDSNDVEITNRSTFAITTVKLKIEFAGVGPKTKTYLHTLDQPIPPNGKYVWKSGFSIPISPANRATLTIDSDQGSVKIAPSFTTVFRPSK